MTGAASLNWRIERACLAAWPAPPGDVVGDWELRLAGGSSQRTNSANPLSPHAMLTPDDLATIEACYRTAGRTPLVRVPDCLAAADEMLARAGWEAGAPTETLHAGIRDRSFPSDDAVRLDEVVRPDWLAARARLSDAMGEPLRDHATPLARIAGPVALASVVDRGRIAAVAYAAIDAGVVVLESVATDPALRRRGHAGTCVTALLGWAQARGIADAALQVRADNAAALRLYGRLGFVPRYRYHYRAAPGVRRSRSNRSR